MDSQEYYCGACGQPFRSDATRPPCPTCGGDAWRIDYDTHLGSTQSTVWTAYAMEKGMPVIESASMDTPDAAKMDLLTALQESKHECEL